MHDNCMALIFKSDYCFVANYNSIRMITLIINPWRLTLTESTTTAQVNTPLALTWTRYNSKSNPNTVS